MPNRPKEPHAKDPRKLDSGRWQARVTYYDTTTGQRKETSQTFATEREAKKWGREQEQAYREEPNRKAPTDEMLAEFFPRWIKVVEARGLAPKTVRDYRQMSDHPINAFGHKALKSISAWDIQQLYTAMAETHSSRTINYVHTVLKSALNDAVDWDLIPINPAAKVKAPRGQRRPVRIVTPDEAARLLAVTQGTRWHSLWALMLHTGLRPGEAIAIRWQDIYWDTHILRVVQAVSVDQQGHYFLGPTKTERSTRPIAMGPHMLELLRKRQADQAIEREVAKERWEEQDLVFTTRHGKLLSPRNVLRDFHRDCDQAKLPKSIHPHSLRHTMASHWLAAGQSIKVVSERLGHTSVAFTLQTYVHLLPNQQADAAQAMDTALFEDDHPHVIPTNL